MDPSTQPQDFPIACYRFHLRVTRPLTLPVYKGSTFHGGFGHALGRIGPRYRNYFFTPSPQSERTARQALPKPFMLIPPLEEKMEYVVGDDLQCGLMLYGGAINHFMIAFAALECLGRDLGLGRNEGRFRIDSVDQLTMDNSHVVFADDAWFPMQKPICVREILNSQHISGESVTLSFATRLRLKHDNLLVREPPSFIILLDRILGRVNSLAALYGGGALVPQGEKRQLLRLAESVKIHHAGTNARWVEWDRPPKPGKEKMSFGGLLGDISYTGDVDPFIPWLSLGQWTGVGGKTSFGLGKYRMEVAS